MLLSAGKARPFIALWLLTALLYLPAWRSGFVTDAIDWLYGARTLSFRDYLNRPHSTIHSLYQLTQLSTLGIFRLFGTARLPWYLLMVSLQAVNAWLLYLLARRIFDDAGISRAGAVAFGGSLIFCTSPYLSEVLVWKACFHYLQGLLLMLGILHCVLRYLRIGEARWAWISGLLFAASTFSLELFYLTPFFTGTLILYDRRSAYRSRALLLLFLPQLLLFLGNLLLFHAWYGEWISHSNGGGLAVPLSEYLSKGLKYLFHLLLFGRFWPQWAKEWVYGICERPALYWAVYILILCLTGYLLLRARRSPRSRVALLLLLWTAAATALVLPMPLDTLFDLRGNRYLYLSVCFWSMLLALGLMALRRIWLIAGIGCIWILAGAFLTLRTNRHWQTSTQITERLLRELPPAGGRTRIMLSLPYCYKGIPMINAFPYGNFRRMHNMLETPEIREGAYDAAAFNMSTLHDGAEAAFVNDSTVRVTLLQWGTWWWYKDFGGYSYETPDYRLDMRDQGHWYELILKRPVGQYQLLYLQNGEWRELR